MNEGVTTDGSNERLAKSSAQQVSELVDEAAQDVTYYMSKAPLFDFTILNTPE
jgi:hypothetical protein